MPNTSARARLRASIMLWTMTWGRTHLSLHYVNDLLAEGAACAEYFHLVSPAIHSITLLPISGLEYAHPLRMFT